jgi:hypothetical protein
LGIVDVTVQCRLRIDDRQPIVNRQSPSAMLSSEERGPSLALRVSR